MRSGIGLALIFLAAMINDTEGAYWMIIAMATVAFLLILTDRENHS